LTLKGIFHIIQIRLYTRLSMLFFDKNRADRKQKEKGRIENDDEAGSEFWSV